MALDAVKGKATRVGSSWWDIHSILDTQRPVVWASTSVLFSPHPSQPLVAARHLSSTKQFSLQSPSPILSAPTSYESPTVISVSPAGDWLFAFFPSGDSDMDGVGCLWQRGAPIDAWVVRQFWSLHPGAGIVSATWLAPPREWIIDDAGSPTRLPPRGPQTPLSNPTLVLVTENRLVSVCYLPQYAPAFKMTSCSLAEPGTSVDALNTTGSASVKHCIRAAIGLAYNDATIIIATRSRTLASEPKPTSLPTTMDLALDLEMRPPQPEYLVDWGGWGEDEFIELCEVRIKADPSGVIVATSPLPPLHGNGVNLANMVFFPVPPGADDRNHLYLAANFLEFSDFASNPTSELVLYGLSRDSSGGHSWACRHTSARSFTDCVVAYVARSASGQSASTFGLFAGLIDSTGSLRSNISSKTEIQTGVIKVLKIPSLSDHELWGTARIMSQVENAGRDVPLDAVLSQNDCMVLCSSPLSFGSSPITLHSSPRLGQSSPVAPAPSQLAIALLSGTSTADLTHLLAHSTISLSQVGETLFDALKILGRGPDIGRLTWRALGLILETYRLRALKAPSPLERKELEIRWQTAFDICSITSCNSAFVDCQLGDVFDLSAVWQLVALSTWIVTFVEKLLRECVLVTNMAKLRPDSQTGAAVPSIMLHVAHPIALRNLHMAVAHVNKLRNKIASLSASEESSHLAKSVLVDLIQCSGVDLKALEPLLAEFMEGANKFNAEEAQRSLALCKPTTAMMPHITAAIEKLAQTAVLDRSRLFIKTSELVDGVSIQRSKEGARDLVSKSALQGLLQVTTCVRCGGKSEVGGGINMRRHSSVNWAAWEKMWAKHCICGGAWITRSS
ncbi:hypothetical protein C8F01DRAFT_1132759 [Mycena amicta]|nr:hypothetical protein C8F01DRAFT_1132759 [Mycena amicta]